MITNPQLTSGEREDEEEQDTLMNAEGLLHGGGGDSAE